MSWCPHRQGKVQGKNYTENKPEKKHEERIRKHGEQAQANVWMETSQSEATTWAYSVYKLS